MATPYPSSPLPGRPAGRLVVVALLTALAAGGAGADDRFDEFVARVKERQAAMKTLTAAFVQEKESSLLLEHERAEGRFVYVAPDRVRWEYESPNPMTVLIHGDEMLTWYRDLGRADEVRIGRYSEQVLKYLGSSASLDTLRQYFRIETAFPDDPAADIRVRLLPLYRRVARRLSGLTIWFDPELLVPVRLRYDEPSGDVTEYSFQDLVVNGEVPPETFEIELPPEVERRTLDLGVGG